MMKKKWLAQSLAALAVAALSMPVAAGPAQRSLLLGGAAKIGKVEVGAGEYRVLVDGQKVSFMQGRTVLAETQGRWETRDVKFRRDGYVQDNGGRLRELRFAGSNQVLVLVEP